MFVIVFVCWWWLCICVFVVFVFIMMIVYLCLLYLCCMFDDCVFSVDQRKEYADSINRQMHQFQHRVEVNIIIIIVVVMWPTHGRSLTFPLSSTASVHLWAGRTAGVWRGRLSGAAEVLGRHGACVGSRRDPGGAGRSAPAPGHREQGESLLTYFRVRCKWTQLPWFYHTKFIEKPWYSVPYSTI